MPRGGWHGSAPPGGMLAARGGRPRGHDSAAGSPAPTAPDDFDTTLQRGREGFYQISGATRLAVGGATQHDSGRPAQPRSARRSWPSPANPRYLVEPRATGRSRLISDILSLNWTGKGVPASAIGAAWAPARRLRAGVRLRASAGGALGSHSCARTPRPLAHPRLPERQMAQNTM